jgi:hypothetical protein
MLLPHSDQPADQPQRPLKKRSIAGVFHRTQYHVQEDDHHDPVGAADEPRDHASVPPAQCDPEYDPDYVSPSERASFPQPPDDFSEALKKEWFAMLKRDKEKIDNGVFLDSLCANPYLISTQAYDAFLFDWDTFHFDDLPLQWDNFRFDWEKLEDLHDKILSFAGLQVVCELDYERLLPDELRPPGMHGDPSSLMTKTYCFERSRASIEEHGPHDKLTVTFSECVNRTWWGFAKEAESRGVGWPLDPDAVSAAMDVKQTWSGVSKIVLRPIKPRHETQWSIELVLEGEDCQQVVTPSHLFTLETTTNKNTLERRLIEQLLLRHTWANFVHVYYI